MTGAPRRLSCSAAALAAIAMLAGASGATQAASTAVLPEARGELVLTFDGSANPEPGRAHWLQNSGGAAVTTTVRTASGGTVGRVPGRVGAAARFPAFAPTPTPAGAIVVRPVLGADGDALNPDKLAVRWGADVYLGKASQTSRTDNGANVVQRGLYGDPAQVKLQLDQDQPACRVKGAAGSATALSGVTLRPALWYRINCQLRAGELTMQVEELSGTAPPVVVRAKAAVGQVSFPSSVPIAIGAKCDGAGELLASDTDQFNGQLNNVFWDVG